MYTGFHHATRAGISLCIEDLVVPEEKKSFVHQAKDNIKEIQSQFLAGLLTQGERYNKIVDIWSRTKEKVAQAMMKKIATEKIQDRQGNVQLQPSFNSVFLMVDSGARGSLAQMQQLSGMRGAMTDTKGSIIENAIEASFRDGLSVAEYFISTHGARKGLADTALKTANSGYLTRRLVDVAQDVVITIEDCQTLEGIQISSTIEGSEIMVSLKERILGRVLAKDIELFGEDQHVLKRNTLLEESVVNLLEEKGVEQVIVRSPITCVAENGICALCYGRDLARGNLVNLGEAVGVVAAQSIGEPGTQLTMQTFHVGGVASQIAVVNNVTIKSKGIIKLHNVKLIQHQSGHFVTISRSGQISLQDTHGRERERYKVPYGAMIWIVDGQEVDAGQMVAQWDPHAHPIVTEVAGTIKFVDLMEGVTMHHQIDETTGLSNIIVMNAKQRSVGHKELRPMIQIVDDEGKDVLVPGSQNIPVHYFLPVNAVLGINNGDKVSPGDAIARLPQESTKTQDITGGLPRVADLFEARKPKEPAVLAEIAGIVSFGKETKGKRRLVVSGEKNEVFEVLIPKWRNVSVFEGEHVEKGEVIADGPLNPHDILHLLGVGALTNYIVNEVQEVYRLQGVKINDKHIEVIVREMLRNVSIISGGDSYFLKGEQLEESQVKKVNQKLLQEGKRPATYRRELTRVSLQSLKARSCLSKAAFQNTVQALTRAAIIGEKDNLMDLKARVILGGLMPAGTGLAYKEGSLLPPTEQSATGTFV